jgi:hypothetical protein
MDKFVKGILGYLTALSNKTLSLFQKKCIDVKQFAAELLRYIREITWMH